VTPKSSVEIPPPNNAVLLLIVELITLAVPSSLNTPPPMSTGAVLPVTVTCDRFSVDPQQAKSMPPPSNGAAPFVIFRFCTVNVTPPATVSTEPVALPFRVAPGVPP